MIIPRRAVVAGALSGIALARSASAQIAFGGAAPPKAGAPKPLWQRNAAAAPKLDGRPAITLVVDDLGVVHPGTSRVMALPGPLTLAWFPFAHNLAAQVAEAAARGHEAVLHMPMQATGNGTSWTGPDPLRVDLPMDENHRRLVAALDAVPDIVGLNNHMGSVASLDAALMDMVAAEALKREMLVLDSVTVAHSLVYRQAALAGVPAASRDIFIDYRENADVIREQLALVEAQARRRGHVIAIGHPWALTVEALEEWVPTLEGKGFALWPLSATVAFRNEITLPA
jgi:polysaccharide deacetylase 2 family uncharacterized protein YibQ